VQLRHGAQAVRAVLVGLQERAVLAMVVAVVAQAVLVVLLRWRGAMAPLEWSWWCGWQHDWKIGAIHQQRWIHRTGRR
jgi:hypothetical protein